MWPGLSMQRRQASSPKSIMRQLSLCHRRCEPHKVLSCSSCCRLEQALLLSGKIDMACGSLSRPHRIDIVAALPFRSNFSFEGHALPDLPAPCTKHHSVVAFIACEVSFPPNLLPPPFLRLLWHRQLQGGGVDPHMAKIHPAPVETAGPCPCALSNFTVPQALHPNVP